MVSPRLEDHMTEGTEERSEAEDDRRKFLAACGRFAVTVPPAMTVLLSTSLSSSAIAASVGGDGGGGGGGGETGNTGGGDG